MVSFGIVDPIGVDGSIMSVTSIDARLRHKFKLHKLEPSLDFIYVLKHSNTRKLEKYAYQIAIPGMIKTIGMITMPY